MGPEPGTTAFHICKAIRWTVIVWFVHVVVLAIAVDQVTKARFGRMEHDVADMQKKYRELMLSEHQLETIARRFREVEERLPPLVR
jgi:flagellar biosynthesis/type III secretory pathway M-ring protein FliF/YscJ